MLFYVLLNWDFLRKRLKSYYKKWSYKKKEHKEENIYNKTD